MKRENRCWNLMLILDVYKGLHVFVLAKLEYEQIRIFSWYTVYTMDHNLSWMEIGSHYDQNVI